MALETIYVFHLRRPDEKGIFIHPLEEFDKIIAKSGILKLEGKYGDDPSAENATFFRNTLYRIVENSVDSRMMEDRFIPRFLISSAVFLFIYLFLSIVVRDPLPLIDEIAIGIGSSVLCYILLGKKFKKSTAASKLRVYYREMVDKIAFTESHFIIAVESVLKHIAGKNGKDMIESVKEAANFPVLTQEEYSSERKQLVSCIEQGFKKNLTPNQRKIINKIAYGGIEKNKNLFEKLQPIEFSGDFDINIIVLYFFLKHCS